MKEQSFNVITAKSVANILYHSIPEAYSIVRNTYIEHDKKNTINWIGSNPMNIKKGGGKGRQQ